MLRDPAVRRVVFARFISATGAEAAFIVGIWGRAAYDFRATPAQLALLMGMLGLCGLAGSAVAGVLIDRYGPRRVVMASEALFAPATLALLLPTSIAQLTPVVAVSAFLGFVVLTGISAFPPFLVAEPQRLAKANAVVEVADMAAFVCGPAVGALLVTVGGPDWVFVLDAATSLVAVALLARVRVRVAAAPSDHERTASADRGLPGPSADRGLPGPPADRGLPGPLAELREGMRFAYGVPPLRFCLLIGTLVWMSFGAFAALEPLYFREVLGTGPQVLGWMNALFGAGLTTGSLLVDRWPSAFMSVRAVTLLSVVSGVGAVAYTGTAELWVVAVAAPAWGAVLGMQFPALRTLIQLHTPDALLGRTTGILQVHQQFGELFPLVWVPALAAAWGVQLVLVGSGVVLALVCTLLLPLAAALDRRRSVQATVDRKAEDEPVGVQ
jgi:DHA3 family macrolide efflux protein-like MFS transporter